MNLPRKFEQGKFVLMAEMEPPKGVDVSMMLSNAKRVKEVVDAFVVPEMSNAVMRISSLGGALLLQTEGMEPVLQVCCRDRNRLALQGDLLAAYACGIGSVMAVGGQDPSFGDHHQARSVYDIDLAELLQMIQTLQNGRDMAGVELAGAPDFFAGTACDAGARGKSVELEMETMMMRAEAGARFFITPPLFDPGLLEPFRKRLDSLNLILIPTVLMLKSLGMARYIQANMTHIHIPDGLIERLQRAPDKVRECIRIASELVSAFKSAGYGGVLLSTIGWEKKLPDIIEGI